MERKKILLVDDEPDILEVMGFQLNRAGYDVVSAADGEAAMSVVEMEQPDLLLLDVMMPGINGFEVCRRIKKADPSRKVIIYTAKVDGVDAAQAKESGADEFTVKTADLKYILESISRLTG